MCLSFSFHLDTNISTSSWMLLYSSRLFLSRSRSALHLLSLSLDNSIGCGCNCPLAMRWHFLSLSLPLLALSKYARALCAPSVLCVKVCSQYTHSPMHTFTGKSCKWKAALSVSLAVCECNTYTRQPSIRFWAALTWQVTEAFAVGRFSSLFLSLSLRGQIIASCCSEMTASSLSIGIITNDRTDESLAPTLHVYIFHPTFDALTRKRDK